MKIHRRCRGFVLVIFWWLSLAADAQDKCGPLPDLSTWEFNHVPGVLELWIKEENDEIVDLLRTASEQGRVEIGNPSWTNWVPNWDSKKIESHSAYRDDSEESRIEAYWFTLSFPVESDLIS